MKLHEKMGIDMTTEKGIATILELHCEDIRDGKSPSKCEEPGMDCSKCMAERLFKEIPVKKVQRGCTYMDFNKAVNDWKIYRDTCFAPTIYSEWLAEEIEVEEVVE